MLRSTLIIFVCLLLSIQLCSCRNDLPLLNIQKSIANQADALLVTKPIKLRAYARMNSENVPFEEMEIIKNMEQITGLNIEWTSIPESDWDQRITQVLASKEYPDFIYGPLPGNITRYTKNNIILPLNDFLEDYAPNLTRLFSKHPLVEKTSTLLDGKIYGFPALDDSAFYQQVPYKFFINSQWLDRLNLEMPRTVNDFYDILLAFKTGDPNRNGRDDEIPFALWTENGGGIDHWFSLFGPWGIVDTLMVRDGKVFWGFLTDNFRQALQYYQRLYQEGLIDIESVTQNSGQVRNKSINYLDEATIGVTFGISPWQVLNDKVLHSNPDIEQPLDYQSQYELLMPLEGPNGDRLVYRTTAGIQINRAFIFSKTEHPEAIVRWFDTWLDGKLHSCEARYGKAGTTFEWENESVIFNVPPEGVTLWEWQNMHSPGELSIHYIDQDFLHIEFQHSIKMLDSMTRKLLPHTPQEIWPEEYITGTPEDHAIIAEYEDELLRYVYETMARFIASKTNIDTEWDDFIKQIKRMQADRLLKIHQNQYDRLQNSYLWDIHPIQHGEADRLLFPDG
jgi:putative aldouronate transport system substrate-binding protein